MAALCIEGRVFKVFLRRDDDFVKHLQLVIERADFSHASFLCLRQSSGDVLQIRPDLGQPFRLPAERFSHAFHFSGVVDRMIAVLVVPGGIESVLGLIKVLTGRSCAPTRVVECLGKTVDLPGATRLQAPIYLPGVSPAFAISSAISSTPPPPHERQRSTTAL
ncbi:hypothetical protein A5695_00980 [Mycobacterium sp. E1747]|nr:hypothetical protein A5695_00980 [Mycobacterium sp. E1747]